MEEGFISIKRGTKIIRCTCYHPFQDEKYGKGLRVHNRRKKDGKEGGWRCTVCGTTRQA